MPHIAVDGVRIRYEERGTGGPPVVLLHALGGSTAFVEPQLEALSRHRRVVAVDMRGHGGSDAPEGDYGLATLADDVAGVATSLELERPVVVGHSLGGMVTLELAARHPELPGAIVLLDAPAVMPPGMVDGFRPFVSGMQTAGYLEVLRGFYEMVGGFADRPDRRARLIEDIAATPQHVLAACAAAVVEGDTDSAAGRVRVPVLYVSSGPWYTDVDRFRSLVPAFSTAQTYGSGHFHGLEVPGQVNAILERFLELHATAG